MSKTVVVCKTTVGDIYIDIYDAWSPRGAKRFLKLISLNFFENMAFYRAVPNFLIQFGIPSTPQLRHLAQELKSIEDDNSTNIPFTDGTLSFAGSGPNSRVTEMFFSLGRQRGLGRSPWETPFGRIQEQSLPKLHKINTEYGDFLGGGGPQPYYVKTVGYSYLKKQFPKLDYIISCSSSLSNTNTNTDNSNKNVHSDNIRIPAKGSKTMLYEIARLPFGGEQLIVHNKNNGVRGWFTDNGVLFDNGTRWKHNTPIAQVIFLVLIIICFVRCIRQGYCFKCCTVKKVKNDEEFDGDYDDDDDNNGYEMTHNENVGEQYEINNQLTRQKQKLYTYKNRRSRRRRRLVYGV